MGIFGWSYPPGAENDPNAPYNQNYCDEEVTEPIPSVPVICPCCQEKAEWTESIEEPGPGNDFTSPEPLFLGWSCANCGWEQEAIDSDFDRSETRLDARKKELLGDIEAYTPTHDYKTRIAVPSFHEYFDDMPEEDFNWPAEEAGDWEPSWCDDCETWHKYTYVTEFKRAGGILEVSLVDCDVDGNWDICDSWTSDNPEYWATFYQQSLAVRLFDYFSAWRDYHQWQVDHFGDISVDLDPINDWMNDRQLERIVDDLKKAEENVRSAYATLKFEN